MAIPRSRTPQDSPPRPPRVPGAAPVSETELAEWQGLVWYVVNRIRPRLPRTVSEDEMFSAGMEGLMKASRSYDPSRGAVFKTYAYHRIRGAILDEVRRLDFLPRSVRDKARKEGTQAPAVVGLPTDEDGHESLAAADPEDSAVEQADLRERLAAEIARLPEKLRLVMTLYYGEEMKMRAIGDRLGLTESRVSQLHSNAVARLRRALGPASGM